MHESFYISVSNDNTATLPLFDVDTNSVPMITIGPYFQKNSFRWYIRMPDREEILKIPAPPTAEKKTITFEPIAVVLESPPPPGATGFFSRIHTPEIRHRPAKTPFHRWKPSEKTMVWPELPLRMDSLHPDDILEFEGFSYLRNDGYFSQMSQPSPIKWPLQVSLMLKLHWVPKKRPRLGVKIVNGKISAEARDVPVPEAVSPSSMSIDEIELPDLDID